MSSTTQFKLDHIHPNDRERIYSELKKALEGDTERWQDEYLFKCADGTYKTILDKGFIIRNENQQAIRMIGAMQDISEQRRLQNQLVKEEEKKKEGGIASHYSCPGKRSDMKYRMNYMIM